nr:hypothetical protein [uncultured Desulfobacter sp.]
MPEIVQKYSDQKNIIVLNSILDSLYPSSSGSPPLLESTLPYLTRRAEENTAITGQMSKELETIEKERRRRKSAA